MSTKFPYIKYLIYSIILNLFVFSFCFAFSCDNISIYVDDSWKYIKKASGEQSLEDAQSYMRKAKKSLDEAAFAARDCGCNQAAMELDDASTRARRARDASDVDDFYYQFDKCVRSLNLSIELFNACVR